MTVRTAGGANLNQRAVVRFLVQSMGGLPVVGMTALTVARCRLTSGAANQHTINGVVTVDTSGVSVRCGTDQGIIVTATTVIYGTGYSHDTAVIRGNRMNGIPGLSMTGCTITSTEGYAECAARIQTSVCIVTAATCVMGIRCGAYQCVVVTGCTSG